MGWSYRTAINMDQQVWDLRPKRAEIILQSRGMGTRRPHCTE